MKDRKMMKDGEADNKKVDAAPVKGEAGTNEATPATEVNNTLPDEAPAPEESKGEKTACRQNRTTIPLHPCQWNTLKTPLRQRDPTSKQPSRRLNNEDTCADATNESRN